MMGQVEVSDELDLQRDAFFFSSKTFISLLRDFERPKLPQEDERDPPHRLLAVF